MLISAKEIEIDGKTFVLSKFPAVEGREIITQYIASGLPKLGDYVRNQELMLKLMCYVGVPTDSGQPLMLTSKTLVNNHVATEDSWETLGKIEMAMMEYNCSFFRNGRVSTMLDGFAQKLPAWILKMLTGLSAQLSQMAKPPSTS